MNGDGHVDNQFGNILGALAANNLNAQVGSNDALNSGKEVLLLDERAADFQSADCASASLQMGSDTSGAPKFDGTGSFTADNSFQAGAFTGQVSAGAFESASPLTPPPVSLSIKLAFWPGIDPIPFNLIGAHLRFTRSGNRITGGQINGVLTQVEVQNTLVPALAASLGAKVAADPSSSTSQQLLLIFDIGGTPDPACSNACRNPDGTCAQRNDGVISVCEVGTNSILKNVLNSDVQMFDETGAWHPSAANTLKDSLSIGFGFTAVPASF
jgi:hypothetical protein